MANKKTADSLKGITLDIYYFLLRSKQPLGLREIQKALGLSSPSVAQYHLTKLERAGFVKKEMGNYTTVKLVLQDHIKIKSYLIPKNLLYPLIVALILIVELSLLPETIEINDVAAIIGTLILLLIFSYETIKKWFSKNL